MCLVTRVTGVLKISGVSYSKKQAQSRSFHDLCNSFFSLLSDEGSIMQVPGLRSNLKVYLLTERDHLF